MAPASLPTQGRLLVSQFTLHVDEDPLSRRLQRKVDLIFPQRVAWAHRRLPSSARQLAITRISIIGRPKSKANLAGLSLVKGQLLLVDLEGEAV